MDILTAIQTLADPTLILFMILGVLTGTIVGAIPGLTGPMALGIAIPLTFTMEPMQAILLLFGIYFGAVYAGAITAIMINTPGTNAGAAAALDGYPLTLKGQSRKALQMSAISEFIGAFISVLALVLFAPLLSKVAMNFGPSEYFALGIFGLSVVASVAGKSLSKALFVAAIGVFISLIGRDPVTGVARFTFGSPYLEDGVPLVAALIGLFAISEVLKKFLSGHHSQQQNQKIEVTGEALTFKEFRRSFKTMIKGGFIGVFIGILPGSGAVIASFLSYNEAIRSSKTPENYGKGELDGVAAVESGAGGTEASSVIPLLTFGIPGDVSTAIILGAMILHGIQVGPQLFEHSGGMVSSLFLGILILEIIVLIVGWYGSIYIAKIAKVPTQFLFPIIIVLIVTGTFALQNSIFTVWVTLLFGLIGFAMHRFGYPVPPLLLGLILGPIIERNFLRSVATTGGDLSFLYTRPITLGILIAAVFFIYLTINMHRKSQKRMKPAGTDS
ncbi:tripartite tricarboxylate transporter permease [Marinicrinis sediminis]|uniref:Tripartite tricarboxylate transporter permease n=1 Tax=Marinicrinis sediminis TaxID=1652465 RepID=A0ABW5R7F6_9BACL